MLNSNKIKDTSNKTCTLFQKYSKLLCTERLIYSSFISSRGQLQQFQQIVLFKEDVKSYFLNKLNFQPSLQHARIGFDSRFCSGNLLYVFKPNSNKSQFDLVLACDLGLPRHVQWFFFRLTNKNLKGKLVIRIYLQKTYEGLEKSGICMRTHKSQPSWERVLLRAKIKQTNNTLKYSQKVCYKLLILQTYIESGRQIQISLGQPYEIKKLNSLMAKLAHPSILCQTLAEDLSGQHLNLVTVRQNPLQIKPRFSPTLTVICIGRQTPLETYSSFFIQSLLLDIKLQIIKFCQNVDMYIFPMINPEGVFLGNSRCDSKGIDFTKNWEQHKALNLDIIQKLIRSHQLLDVAMQISSSFGKETVLIQVYHNSFIYNYLKQVVGSIKILAECQLKFVPFTQEKTFQQFIRKNYFGKQILNLKIILPQNLPSFVGHTTKQQRLYIKKLSKEILNLLLTLKKQNISQQSQFKIRKYIQQNGNLDSQPRLQNNKIKSSSIQESCLKKNQLGRKDSQNRKISKEYKSYFKIPTQAHQPYEKHLYKFQRDKLQYTYIIPKDFCRKNQMIFPSKPQIKQIPVAHNKKRIKVIKPEQFRIINRIQPRQSPKGLKLFDFSLESAPISNSKRVISAKAVATLRSLILQEKNQEKKLQRKVQFKTVPQPFTFSSSRSCRSARSPQLQNKKQIQKSTEILLNRQPQLNRQELRYEQISLRGRIQDGKNQIQKKLLQAKQTIF